MMMLQKRRDHLLVQRRLRIGRALAGTMVAAVPVPIVDDLVLQTVLGNGYRRLAEAYHVELSDAAVHHLVHGRVEELAWYEAVLGGVGFRVATRAAKRAWLAVAAVRNAGAASRLYVVLTLFEHYCATLHTGLGLDGEQALQLREEIARSIAATPGALGFHPFRKGAVAAARSMMKAPLAFADRVSGGRLRAFLQRRSEVVTADAISNAEREFAAQLAARDSVLGRIVFAIEAQLTADHNPYLDRALDIFETRWRARVAAQAATHA